MPNEYREVETNEDLNQMEVFMDWLEYKIAKYKREEKIAKLIKFAKRYQADPNSVSIEEFNKLTKEKQMPYHKWFGWSSLRMAKQVYTHETVLDIKKSEEAAKTFRICATSSGKREGY